MPNATQQPFQQYAAAPQQPQAPQYAPPPIPAPDAVVQSVELGGARWRKEVGFLKVSLAQLVALIGLSFPTADGDNDGALPIDDLMRDAETGEVDLDFEESSIEILGKIVTAGNELLNTAERFRYNLHIRDHSDGPPGDQDEDDNNADGVPSQ
jgi:hypothetical protein